MWRHPDMSADELSELIPRHSPKAIRSARHRVGRYRANGFTPLCQKCGEHPVAESDPWARRRGLCASCALDEKEWEQRHAEELRRRNDARRQRLCKARRLEREASGS